ncbi:hypothetical protein PV08_00415 [Exophiala spinifera]|uniref:Uncharacterized protein n=1 Tax=Exophiala spinifera TaxID=91928 RepID=A0A0D2BMN5_9EURO|nr:uncharacterized protein PV08_00415 [Exophiala spinifera]KIW19840.1 hypothetical protein PV08_00415 [Exophiala spinifera]
MEEYEASPRSSKRRRTGTYATRRTTLDTSIPRDSTTHRSQSSKQNGVVSDNDESAPSSTEQEDARPLEPPEDSTQLVETTSRRSSTRKRKPTERAAQAEEDATPTRIQKPIRRNVKKGEDGSLGKPTKPAGNTVSGQAHQNEQDDIEPPERSGRKASSRALSSDTTRIEKRSTNTSASKGKASKSAVGRIESDLQSQQPKSILTPTRRGHTTKSGPRKSVVFDADERQIEAQLGFRDINNSAKSQETNKTRQASENTADAHQSTPSRNRHAPGDTELPQSASDDDLDVPDIQTVPDVDEILLLNTAGADIHGDKQTLLHQRDNEHVATIKGEILRRITNKSLPPICHLHTQYSTLHSLLFATITAGESNSLLLLGSRGSGKSLLVSHALADLTRSYADDFHVVKLDGFFQTDDKLALREIWRQLGREMAVPEEEAGEVSSYADTMASLLSLLSHPEELAEPDLDTMDMDIDNNHGGDNGDLKTTKSIIFIMDEFDLFTTHPRQTLLYNLFDIAQAKKAPIAVIGCSTRMDVVDCLEKRVKSRFSHRWLHVPSAKSLPAFEETVSSILSMRVDGKEALGVSKDELEWRERWNHAMKTTLLPSSTIQALLKKTYYSTKSLPDVLAALYIPVATLSVPIADDDDDDDNNNNNNNNNNNTNDVAVNVTSMIDAVSTAAPSLLMLLPQLPTLHLSLLIAAARLETVHNLLAVNFALAYTHYTELLARAKLQRSSLSVMNRGGSTLTGAGLRQWSKATARGAWEDLAQWEVIVPASGAGAGGTGRSGDDGLVAGEGVGTKIFRVDVTLDEIAWAVKERAGGTGVGDVLVKWCSDV